MLPPALLHAAVAVADHPLAEAERASAAGFAPRRLRTFSSGRAAARLALGSLDPIGVGARGAPAAPDGWRLSISHTDTIAVAVACRDHEADGVGVDVEDVSRMDLKLRRHVVGALDRVPEDADATLLTATFSLRESLFKALAGEGAEAAFIRWDGGVVDIGVEGRPLTLRHGWTCVEGHVLSWCQVFPLSQ